MVGQVSHYRRRQRWSLAFAVGAFAALVSGLVQLFVALPMPTSEQGSVVVLMCLTTLACLGSIGWLHRREQKVQPLITFDLKQRTVSWPVPQTPFERVRLIRIQRGLVGELVLTQGGHRLILGTVGLGEDLSPIERTLHQHLSAAETTRT